MEPRIDAPATTRKVTVRLPEELVPIFEKLAEEHGRSMHAELRAALAFWAEAHTVGKSAEPVDPNAEKPPKD